MKNTSQHPARSPDFLSRLHDGELTAAERAHFESHRAHCVECRSAAVEFEAALSLYRSSRTAPPSPDLAARILQRLQAATPRRRSPFGISFGIDVRWAGAFAAALVAMIIGSAIVVRQGARDSASTLAGETERAASAPIPVFVQDEPKTARSGEQAPPPSEAPATASRAAAPPAVSAPSLKEREAASAPGPASHDEVRQAAEAPLPKLLDAKKEDLGRRGKDSSVVAPDAAPTNVENALVEYDSPGPPPKKQAPRSEAQSGGEGAAASGAAPSATFGYRDGAEEIVLFDILPLDGAGSAPPLTERGKEIPSELRGRSFIVIVESNGRIRSVTPIDPSDKARSRMSPSDTSRQGKGAKGAKANEKTPAQAEAAPKALLDLRFEPGDRARRILVRVK